MKKILISVRPKWCEKICHVIGKEEAGKPIYEKRIEVRKSAPKEVPFKAYIYATRPKKFYKCGAVSTSDELLWLANGKVEMGDGFKFWADGDEYQCLNGRIIGEFICDRIEMVNAKCSDYGIDLFYHDCLTNGCLTEREIEKYFNIPEDKDLRVMKGNGYAWHISDLKIYDKPKELSELWGRKNCLAADTVECWNCFAACREINGRRYQPLRRPPQSWCYIEETALWTNK